MPFDAKAAKQAGYSDNEIADYLGKQNKFDTGAARKAGYSDAEIIGQLSADQTRQAHAASQQPGAPQPADVTKFDKADLEASSQGFFSQLGDQLTGKSRAPGMTPTEQNARWQQRLAAANSKPQEQWTDAEKKAVELHEQLHNEGDVSIADIAGVAPIAAVGKSALKAGESLVSRDALKTVKDAGYLVAPSERGAGVGMRMAEGAAGSKQLATEIAARNQVTTNNLVKQELGLPKDQPITEQTLQTVREKAGQAYDAVKQAFTSPELKNVKLKPTPEFTQSVDKIGKSFMEASKDFPLQGASEVGSLLGKLKNVTSLSPETMLEATKQFRASAGANLMDRADPVKLQLGKAQKAAADAIDGLLEQNLNKINPQLASDYRAARTTIAKSYAVEGALEGTNVNAAKLAKDKALTGNLKTVATAAQHFPKSVTSAVKTGYASPVDATDIAAGVIGGAAGGLGGVAAAAIRPAARAVLSRGGTPATPGKLTSMPAVKKFLLNNLPKEVQSLLSGGDDD